jgi:CubicO group peptidase (beta-lactamase class C family)
MRTNVRDVVERGLADGMFAGAVVQVSRGGREVLHEAFGHAEVTPRLRAMTTDAVFDVASLTKVMATLPAVLRSVQLGRLNLEQTVLPNITIQHLLTHISGLPAWKPLYLWAQGRAAYREQILAEPLAYPTCKQAVYSDLGMILLGFVLEDVWEQPLAELTRELVFEPLGMADTGYLYSGKNAVATEVGNGIERRMCLECAAPEAVEKFPWRTETICGEVNDGNCHYGLQGVSGHAGLFSTAADTARYLQMWAEEGAGFLSPELIRLATSSHTVSTGLTRGLGWEVGAWAGEAFLPDAFGHTGFTGTSMWYERTSRTAVVAFTNRLHPVPAEQMPAWRRLLHRAAFT